MGCRFGLLDEYLILIVSRGFATGAAHSGAETRVASFRLACFPRLTPVADSFVTFLICKAALYHQLQGYIQQHGGSGAAFGGRG